MLWERERRRAMRVSFAGVVLIFSEVGESLRREGGDCRLQSITLPSETCLTTTLANRWPAIDDHMGQKHP